MDLIQIIYNLILAAIIAGGICAVVGAAYCVRHPMDPCEEYPRCRWAWPRICSIIRHGILHNQKLTIDLIGKPYCLGGDVEYRRVDRWTSKTYEELNQLGYKKAVGFHDNLLWMTIPVYARHRNLYKFDTSQTDKDGNYIYPQDTAATLNDWMQSSATDKFIKGMARAKLPGMDLQQIAMIAVLGVGVIIGLHVLGVF